MVQLARPNVAPGKVAFMAMFPSMVVYGDRTASYFTTVTLGMPLSFSHFCMIGRNSYVPFFSEPTSAKRIKSGRMPLALRPINIAVESTPHP